MPGEPAEQAKEQDDRGTHRDNSADAQDGDASRPSPPLPEARAPSAHSRGGETSGMLEHGLSVRGRPAAEASASAPHEPGVRRQEQAGAAVVAAQESESKRAKECKSVSKRESGHQDCCAPAAGGAAVKLPCKQLCVTISFDKASYQVCTCWAGLCVCVLAAGLAGVPATTLDGTSWSQSSCRGAMPCLCARLLVFLVRD